MCVLHSGFNALYCVHCKTKSVRSQGFGRIRRRTALLQLAHGAAIPIMQSVRKEVWYVVCLAALTAMLRARGVMFSTLTRTGLEPALEETRAVDLLLAALKDFAACQGGVSSFSDLSQAHPLVLARPNGSLAVYCSSHPSVFA